MKVNVFNSKMALFGDTGITTARYLNISVQSFSKKKNGDVPFTTNEIKQLKKRWSLTNDEVIDIFF